MNRTLFVVLCASPLGGRAKQHEFDGSAVCPPEPMEVGRATSLLQKATSLLQKGRSGSTEERIEQLAVSVHASHRHLGGQTAGILHPDLEQLEKVFSNGVHRLVTQHAYATHHPVVVTAFDENYAPFAVRWSETLRRRGFSQQLIVALDDTAAQVARAHSLPALDSRGQLVTSLQTDVSSMSLLTHSLSLPSNFATAKFMVPLLLLEQSFDSVLFMEADVYAFPSFSPNSFGYRETHRVGDRDSIIAVETPMPGMINIGFMQFHGLAARKVLRQFLDRWWLVDEEQQSTNLVDQRLFNDIMHDATDDFSEGMRVQILSTASGRFCIKLECVNPDTLVAHCALCDAPCKKLFLETAYASGNASVVQHLTSECPNGRLLGT